VRGEGVVGEQPVIEPGGSFDYVSGCPLDTPTGSMEGLYHMVGANGSSFAVAIPRFSLIAPVMVDRNRGTDSRFPPAVGT
jgi:ApaG protein